MTRTPRRLLLAASTLALATIFACISPAPGHAQEPVTVTGTVTDGSGHGWPLYARVEVPGQDPVFTDPLTGRFSVEVPAAGSYAMTVDAVNPGYWTQRRTVTLIPDGAPQDFALQVKSSCTAPGYGRSGGVAVDEDFEAGLPAGWSVVRRSPSGGAWTFDDRGQRGNQTGGSGRFAIADSDEPGPGTVTDTDLITAPLDLSTAHTPQIAFNSDFRDVGGEDRAELAVSIDGGQTWTTLWEHTESRRSRREQIAVPQAAGQPDVRFRFHYFGTWDWWWQIDDVAIGETCAVVPGGLVLGNVTSGSTGAALDGATVTGEDDASAVETGADGFYTLFVQGAGPKPITAKAAGHLPSTVRVDVAADRVTRQDFALDELTPPTVSIALGRSDTVRGLAVGTRDVADVHRDGGVAKAFDGRAAGVPRDSRVDGVATAPGGTVLSFADPVRLPGIAGIVDDSDAVLYAGGSFAPWFDGSDVGLNGDDEDIDALELLADGRILVSTTGTATASGIFANDEDLLAFTPQSLGGNTVGTWAVYFDGSDVGLTDSSEDVDGVAVRPGGVIALSVRECLAVPNLRAGAEDVAAFHPTQLGSDTTGTFAPDLLLDGTTLGLDRNDVTAVELPR
jgi:hypothetical protein